jgi:cytochrome c553
MGLLALLLISAMIIAACSSPQPTPTATVETVEEDHVEGDEHEAEEQVEEEHVEGDEHEADHEHVDVPEDYEGLTNPFAGNTEAIAAGAEIFATNCATCHGDTGMGDGPAAVGLDPKPASLADPDMVADLSDGYFFWRISEGGAMEPFNSAMPVWETVLSEDQIWQVVTFIRSLSE